MKTNRRLTPARALVAVLAVLLVAGSQVLVPQVASAQTSSATKKVPPLVSERPTPASPEVPVGDFGNRPDASPGRVRPAPKASFDPARSISLDAQTTPTRRTWRNADGSFTVEVSARPVRFRDASGAWKAPWSWSAGRRAARPPTPSPGRPSS